MRDANRNTTRQTEAGSDESRSKMGYRHTQNRVKTNWEIRRHTEKRGVHTYKKA